MTRRGLLGWLARMSGAAVALPLLPKALPPSLTLPLAPVAPAFSPSVVSWEQAYTHKTWALGLKITEEAMEDDLYEFYTRGMRQDTLTALLEAN